MIIRDAPSGVHAYLELQDEVGSHPVEFQSILIDVPGDHLDIGPSEVPSGVHAYCLLVAF